MSNLKVKSVKGARWRRCICVRDKIQAVGGIPTELFCQNTAVVGGLRRENVELIVKSLVGFFFILRPCLCRFNIRR